MGLFAFFSLWTTTLAAGATAVSVPIIIHLLNRRRFKIVVWAAMRFLLAAQRQNTRRMRLEQLILLLTRCAIVALVVFAMASVMPWAESAWAYLWPEGGGPAAPRGNRIHHVFVLDGSLSMNAGGDGPSAFERGRQALRDKIKQAPAGDSFSILMMKDSPAWIVGQPSADSRRVLREVEAIHSGHGNGAVATTLNMVSAKLAEAAQRYPAQMVYFITDMQKATWTSLPPTDPAQESGDKAKTIFSDIQQRARTVFVDVGRDDVDNIAVTDLGIEVPFVTTGMKAPIFATLRNYGKENKSNVRVELLVGKARENANEGTLNPRVVGQDLINLRAGEPTPIFFFYQFPEPGAYAIQVRLGDDPLNLDNVRSVIVTVKDTIPVLLVNGKSAPDRFDRATEYLRLAYNPFPKGAERKEFPLRPTVVNLAQFPDMTDAEVLGNDLIVLCDVNQLGAVELRRLDAHVRRGGGLIVSLGEEALENLDLYNRHLFKGGEGLLPAQLFKKITAPTEHFFTLHAHEDQFHERPLKAFAADEYRASLKTGRFRNYIEAKPASDAKLRTIMSFMPELATGSKFEYDKTLPTSDPAIIEWNPPLGKGPDTRTKEGKLLPAARYRGKVVLLTSTVNMDWTTWPGSPAFGSLMQELAQVAMSGRLREQAGVVGSLLEEFVPDSVAEVDATIHYPTAVPAIPPKKTRTQLVEETNIFRWTDTDISGLYRVVLGNSAQEVPFAINVPATTPDQRGSESDLTRLDRAKLQELFPGWDFQVVTDARDAIVGGGPQTDALITPEREPIGPDIAAWALFLVLILMFAEIILAWQFGHYSSVEGATEPPARGLVLPVAVTAIAVFCFGLIAFVLIDASRTGDFLGFLPRTLRNWMEAGIGAPTAPPGEESRWELGGRAVFFDGNQDSWFLGMAGVIALVLTILIYRAEGPTVNPVYKGLLVGLRLFLIWFSLAVLLPQREWRIDRQGWPDIVLLVDTSRSMGESDHYQTDKMRDRAKQLGDSVQKLVQKQLPEKIQALEAELAAKRPLAESSEDLKLEVQELEKRLKESQQQVEQVNSPSWRPTRLQIVQGLLHQPELDWIQTLVKQRRMKVHVYQLDAQGRAIKLADKDGAAGEITEQDPRMVERAGHAIARLEAEGKDSRLGTALRQVIDHYRGSSLAGVVMFTDGVTTRDETIAQVGEYAAQKAVPLYFVGIGDDHEIRDLKLHDLLVDDIVYVNDRVVFEARLTGKGYKKDFSVPIVLKVREKDGKEKELPSRTVVRVNPQGKAERFKLIHQPKEIGRKTFIIEVEAPKADKGEKQPHPANLRLERAIEVVDAKQIKVLYAEGQPRYEYRFIKFLLERESPDAKQNKSIELKTYLQDADPDFAQTDKTAISNFPATQAELQQYDVVIIGDIDPRKLGDNSLRNLADFVRGEDAKGKKLGKAGGLLLIAGGMHNPHSFQGTPLADVIPIEPGNQPVEPVLREDKLRLELTPIGRLHPIFRFSSDDAQNMLILQKLAPMYWWSGGYRLKPLAEVLAVHPSLKGDARDPASHDGRLPLVVQQFVGAGRSMFFGFDETWRWRHRDDESNFNNFWIQTMRYLSRTRPTRTDLRLDRQTPYRVGEPIKITVRFPDSTQLPGITDNKDPKAEVKVLVQHYPPAKGGAAPAPEEVQTVQLAKLEGSWGTFEHQLTRTREGKYTFRLMTPDVSKLQPDGEKPSAEALVELPPGELDRLRMNETEMSAAAEATQGKFYTITSADALLEELPSGYRVSMAAPMPPIRLWNHWLAFALVMFLLTAEWVLRKRKHLL